MGPAGGLPSSGHRDVGAHAEVVTQVLTLTRKTSPKDPLPRLVLTETCSVSNLCPFAWRSALANILTINRTLPRCLGSPRGPALGTPTRSIGAERMPLFAHRTGPDLRSARSRRCAVQEDLKLN